MDIHCTLTLCSLNHTRKSTTNTCTYLAFRRQLVRKTESGLDACRKHWLFIFIWDFWRLIQEVESKKLFSRFRCQYARTFHYWTLGTRKWSYLRWVSMMDRECCSTSCPISSDPRQLAFTLATCYSSSQIAAARLDVRAPACTWGSSGGIERDPAWHC